jgi:ABC-type Mn2+/Zn2+ transport system permease subunit
VIEIFWIYRWVFVVATAAAILLALIGIHLTTRREALQSLSLSQNATTGALLALLAFNHSYGVNSFFLGLVITASLSLAISSFEKWREVTIDLWHLSSFLGFMAFNFALTSSVPTLEGHMAQSFFGDVATLSGERLYLIAFVSGIGLSFLSYKGKSLFEKSVLLALYPGREKRDWSFYSLVLIILTASIGGLGFLFTMSMLFLPTTLMRSISKNLRAHIILCIFLAITSTVLGISLSLYFERISTVPAIVLGLFIIALTIRFGDLFKKTA